MGFPLLMDYNPVSLFFVPNVILANLRLLNAPAFVITLQFVTILLCSVRAISDWVIVSPSYDSHVYYLGFVCVLFFLK